MKIPIYIHEHARVDALCAYVITPNLKPKTENVLRSVELLHIINVLVLLLLHSMITKPVARTCLEVSSDEKQVRNPLQNNRT